MGVPCAHSDVGVGDVGRAGFREQESDRGCMACVEGDHVGEGLTDEARQTGLFGGIPDRLGENCRRDGDPHAALHSPRDEDEHVTVMAVQGDQRAGVQSDAGYAACGFRERRLGGSGERMESAQARSL